MKNLWHFLKRGCLMKWLIFISCGLKLFFPLGKLALVLHSAFHQRQGCLVLSGLINLDVSWLSKSLFSRLDSRYQNEAISTCVPAHAQTLGDSSWAWALLTLWHHLMLLSLALHKMCQGPWQQQETASPCKWEGLLPYVVAAHPSLKQSFKSVLVFTHPQHLQRVFVVGTQQPHSIWDGQLCASQINTCQLMIIQCDNTVSYRLLQCAI